MTPDLPTVLLAKSLDKRLTSQPDWEGIIQVHIVFFRLKGQINQNFDIFSFNPIYLVCVDLVSNKHILKFQVN